MVGQSSAGRFQQYTQTVISTLNAWNSSLVSHLCKRFGRCLVDRSLESMLSVVLSLIHPYSNPSLSDSTSFGRNMVDRYH